LPGWEPGWFLLSSLETAPGESRITAPGKLAEVAQLEVMLVNDPHRSRMQAIFLDGVLRWGLLSAALYLVLDRFLWGTELSWRSVLIAAVVFPVAGASWGYWQWRSRNRDPSL